MSILPTRLPPPLIYPEGSEAGCDSYGINQTFCGRQKVIKEKKRKKEQESVESVVEEFAWEEGMKGQYIERIWDR